MFGCDRHRNAFGLLALGLQRPQAGVVEREGLQRTVAALEVEIVGEGDGAQRFLHLHQAVLIRKGQRTEKQAIDQREDGGGGADAEGQHQNGDQGGEFFAAHGAPGVSEVLANHIVMLHGGVNKNIGGGCEVRGHRGGRSAPLAQLTGQGEAQFAAEVLTEFGRIEEQQSAENAYGLRLKPHGN
ncbi:MAG TPA: hypothetical protein VNY05_36400 [Candidatus Acidoferrales bacterium]|jgi:hypothetical protein|nr:hypothetical protein [Candidatus Acidoferrales bacterium]